jgi:hypothetical protein
MRTSLSLALLVTAGCASAPVSFECFGDAPLCDIYEVVGEDLAPAGGISVTGVEVNQGVAIPLLMDGETVEPAIPLVAGRDTLVRVYVETQDDWQARDVVARVYLYDGDFLVGAAEGRGSPIGASEASSLGSTLNVRLDGAQLPERPVQLRVELVEASPEVGTVGRQADNVWPEEGGAALEIRDTGPATRIYLVPVEGGTPPQIDEAFTEYLRADIRAWFPVDDVEIEVGEPFDFGRPAAGAGAMSPLLQAMTELRESRDIDDDQYIYGMTFDYGGGLSWVGGSPTGERQRASVGGPSVGVVSHEIGHAHGRLHAPCPLPGEPGAPGNQDASFPHERGIIGAWGWNQESGQIYDPTEITDFMSYCSSNWISDYTWRGMLQRAADMHSVYGEPTAPEARRVERAYQEIWVHGDGTATWGRIADWEEGPHGRVVDVVVETPAGPLEVEAVWTRHAHGFGGVLLLEPDLDVQRVRFRGETLAPVPLADLIPDLENQLRGLDRGR